MPDQAPIIVWFRQDLRLRDNPALDFAVSTGRVVIPVFILDDETPGHFRAGGASRWWLHNSLASLASSLASRYRSRLIMRRGEAAQTLDAIMRDTGAGALAWNRTYEPFAIARDTRIKGSLKARGIAVETFNASLLVEPWAVQTKTGGPFQVFTAFWKAAAADLAPPRPRPELATLPHPDHWPVSDSLDSLRLLPTAPDWAKGLRDTWIPGEMGAEARLRSFIEDGLAHYASLRDSPAEAVTSRLSAHLHWGEISPHRVWHAARDAEIANPGLTRHAEKFIAELGWREFSHHLLYHFPEIPAGNFKKSFDAFPWADNPAQYRSWTKGMTGYPIVDAGMRELWHTGTMHNRVRMIVASFLTKHLLIDWRRGADWFWDTLVDADLANNAASWQWVAGSGADAAPYFRIFNPTLQGEKFDADGAYVRRHVPELAKLPGQYIHAPWRAPADVLRAANVRLGETYPAPIIDHDAARARALAAFSHLKSQAA